MDPSVAERQTNYHAVTVDSCNHNYNAKISMKSTRSEGGTCEGVFRMFDRMSTKWVYVCTYSRIACRLLTVLQTFSINLVQSRSVAQ